MQSETTWTVHYLPGTHPLGNGAAREPESVQASAAVTPDHLQAWTVLVTSSGEAVKMIPTAVVATIDHEPVSPGLPADFGEELPAPLAQPPDGFAMVQAITCAADCRDHPLHVADAHGDAHPVYPVPTAGAVARGTATPPVSEST